MLQIRVSNDFADAVRVFHFTKDLLQGSYPMFRHWWWKTVVPGMVKGDDRMVLAETLKGELAGICAVKKSPTENKIRALRVARPFAGQTLAGHLLETSFKYLGDDYPVASVSEGMMKTLAPFMINRYGFKVTEVKRGQYLPGVDEYWFNTNHQKKPQPLKPLHLIKSR